MGSPGIIDTTKIPSTSQRNVLVVGIDDLNGADPVLESVWVIATFPDSPRVVILPVFPLPSKESDDINKELVDAFKPSSKRLLTEAFLSVLKERNLWWSDYVVLDKKAVETILAFVGNTDKSNRTNTTNPIVSLSSQSIQGREKTYHNQLGLMTYLCRAANHTDESQGVTSILDLIPEHVRTNIKSAEIINQWQRLKSYQGGISCVFPTLN